MNLGLAKLSEIIFLIKTLNNFMLNTRNILDFWWNEISFTLQCSTFCSFFLEPIFWAVRIVF